MHVCKIFLDGMPISWATSGYNYCISFTVLDMTHLAFTELYFEEQI